MWLVRTSVMVWVPQWGSREGGSPRLPILSTPPFFWAWASPVQPATRATATSPPTTALLPFMGIPLCVLASSREAHPSLVGTGALARGPHGRAAPHERQGLPE